MRTPLIAVALLAASTCSIAGGIEYPEGAETPRNLTAEEALLVEREPLWLNALRAVTDPPDGPVSCPGEYEPMDGIIVGWEGSSSWHNILAQLGAAVTTTGDANFYVITDFASEVTDATNRLNSYGANMSKVQFMSRTLDSIWMRDYGPRYIYVGDTRAVVDHTYNRPRPNDNLFPEFFAAQKGHTYFGLPLVHGGGNYHISTAGDSFTTRLINNENPGLTEPEIHDIWAGYQNVDTTFSNPFPTFIDSTQHIDMWMQVIDDNAIVISDWPNNPGSTQDQICDAMASQLSTQGWTVHRVPAFSVGGTHYTYTNVVMCNDAVVIPSYTNSSVSPFNDDALAVWQAALPSKTISQVNGQSIVTAAGVFHCIVMHVPAHRGGDNPTAYLRNPNGGESLNPGDSVDILWLSDDDQSVSNVDLLLSTDGGATFPTVIASQTADDGSFTWTVPDVFTTQARIRVVARDAQANTGSDDSDANFAINGTPNCPGDTNGDNDVDFTDLNILLSEFGDTGPGLAADFDGDEDVDFSDLNVLLSAFGDSCI